MKKRILVVDDDFMIRELLKAKLSKLDFEVVTAGNEKEFWERTFTAKPDLIILDILLKNKNGPSVYQNLVDFVNLDPDIPVIFISALLNKEMALPAPSGGPYTFLTKPLDFETLAEEINRLLLPAPRKRLKIKSPTAALAVIFMLSFSPIPEAHSQEITDGSLAGFPQESPKTLRGIAAWYSEKDRHIRRHTANGEVFDDSQHSCAVWEFPFGTHLRVTNLENQKSVICRVNDRGPAKHLGRRIDLTRTAFRRIASLRRGLAKVSVTPTKKDGRVHLKKKGTKNG